MSNKNNTLPIGRLLKAAGLISDRQLEEALLLQSEYTSMKLGEILVSQKIIETQTVTFFVNKWEEIKQEGQQFPLGYYLVKASLLDDEQVRLILEEQKQKKLRFGDLAVQKGWIARNTINFFLDALAIKPSELISLIQLEEYDREHLNLERKYAGNSLILSRVLAWTGGNATLSKNICRVFAESNLNIPPGGEITAVDRLIEGSLIKNWQTSQLGAYVKSIQENLLNSSRCEPILLLKEYQAVLLSGSKKNEQTKAQQELLNLGLIVSDREELRVTNLIYQQIFNPDWLVKSIGKLESETSPVTTEIASISKPRVSDSNSLDLADSDEEIAISNHDRLVLDREDEIVANAPSGIKINNTPVQTYTTKVNSLSTITKFTSLLTLAGLALLIPFVLAINNYYSSLQQERELTSESNSELNSLRQFCSQINLIDPPSSLNLIYQLETNREKILSQDSGSLQQFPDNCEKALNRLIILAAPQLGKENRVIEAIKNLCKIPAESDSIAEAHVWLEHWSNSDSWGQATKSYLNLVERCPASDRL